MNSTGAQLLVNPHPCGHIVYPYTDEGLVGQAVCLFASSGLRDGDGVILIMSTEHCDVIKLRLTLEGYNADQYEQSGQLICVSAEELLQSFLVGGVIDDALFTSSVEGLIEKVKTDTTTPGVRRVRIFGEMVSQLRHSDVIATTHLEELWNDIIDKHSVALLCTYALNYTGDNIPEALIALHSHNIERQYSVEEGR